MRQGKRRFLWAATALGVLAVLGIVIAARLAERSLLQRSARIADTATWLNDSYTWQGDGGLIFMRHDDAEDACLLFRLDPRTRGESPLTQFNQTFGREIVSTIDYDYSPIGVTQAMAARRGTFRVQTQSHIQVPGLTFSPDGKWLAWKTVYQVNGGPEWIVCTVDGKRRIPVRPLPGFAWESAGTFTPDNNWVSIIPNYGGNTKSAFLLRHIEPGLGAPITKPNPHLLAELIGVTPDHRAVTQAAPVVAGRQILGLDTPDMYVTSIDRTTEPERKLNLCTPPERPYEAVLSPDGLRIAMCVHTAPRLPGPPAFQRMLERLVGTPRRVAQIRVSRLDGSEMHVIGHIPLKANSPYMYTRAENPHALKWTPDGKRLSFVYHATLYTVDAE